MSVLRYLNTVNNEYAGSLVANNTVSPLTPGAAYEWHSESRQPAFTLNARWPIFAGWYMLELDLDHSQEGAIASICCDYVNPRLDAESVEFTAKTRHVSKRVLYLRDRVQNLTLYPTDKTGAFSIRSFRLIPVTRDFAITRMLRRLIDPDTKHQKEALHTRLKLVKRQAAINGSHYLDLLYASYQARLDPNFKRAQQQAYQDWIQNYETPQFSDVARLQNEIEKFTDKPLISIVMPVYNVDERVLREALDSVLAQVYPNWQLCVADDGSSKAHVAKVLTEYAARDSRIDLHLSANNENISVASNHALNMARGEMLALMDHDDLLAAHALYSMVKAYNQNPAGVLFYSDEDKLDHSGERTEPYFKPAWNKDLLYSSNYLCHFSMLKRSLVEAVGGFRKGFEGSQDYDLFLRVVRQAKFQNIVHVPHVLYHWRIAPGSTAMHAGEKSYTTRAGVAALQDHFSELGLPAVRVSASGKANLYRVQYPVPYPAPLVSLLIPTRDKLNYLQPCIESILGNTAYKDFEILVLDNQSQESKTLKYLEKIERHEKIRVLRYDQPFNYSAINNFGVLHARGSLVGLINNDVKIINHDWLNEMVSQASRPEVGCVGAKLLYADETVQHAGVVLGIGGVAGHIHLGLSERDTGYFSRAAVVQAYSAVTGACLLVSKEIYQKVGGLDEVNLKVAFNDVDFCIKVREAGYTNIWTPFARLYHYESKSRGFEDTPEKQIRFQSEVAAMKLKWGKLLETDPAYNPNLSLKSNIPVVKK